MTEIRVWHASRDAYHCAFRMMRILDAKGEALPIERLRVLDMYLLYPALLQRLSLPSEIKKSMRALKLPSDDKMFIRLPSTAAVWQDLQVYQAAALKQLGGRGLLKRDALRDHYAALSEENVPEPLRSRIVAENEEQSTLLNFLVNDVASLPTSGSDNVFKRAGLSARGPIL
jgi:hypothetical protein